MEGAKALNPIALPSLPIHLASVSAPKYSIEDVTTPRISPKSKADLNI